MPLKWPTFGDDGIDMGEGLGIYTPGKVQEFLHGDQIPGVNDVKYDWSGYQQGQQNQQDMNAMLLARAQGRGGPSVAEAQLAQATNANRVAAMSQANSARGGAMQQAAAQRNAQAQGVQVQQQSAGQGATLRAQEQQAAMGQYANALQAQQNTEMQRQIQLGQTQVAQTNAASQRIGQQREQDQSGIGSMVGGIGAIASKLSDERAKMQIHGAEQDVADMFQALHAKRFQYRPGMGEPQGEQVGIIAQDLERTPAGRTLVEHDSEGMRRIDPQRALMSLLAAGADIYDRLRKLEGGR